MSSINANLTEQQIHVICESLAERAQRLANVAQNARLGAIKDIPEQTIGVWENEAADIRNMVKRMIDASQGKDVSPHTPVTFEYGRLYTYAA